MKSPVDAQDKDPALSSTEEFCRLKITIQFHWFIPRLLGKVMFKKSPSRERPSHLVLRYKCCAMAQRLSNPYDLAGCVSFI